MKATPDIRVLIVEDDPFQVLDQAGVGKLIEMACQLGRPLWNRPYAVCAPLS